MTPQQPQPRVRAATESDRERINLLLDSHYSGYAGPLDRQQAPRPSPPVDRRGKPISYLLAEVDGRDVGVVGITQDGDLAEWSVTDNARSDAVADALLSAAEQWARGRGANQCAVMIASDDAVSARALARRGYREFPSPITVMRVVHFSRFLSKVLDARRDRVAALPHMTARIMLTPGRYPQLPETHLRIELFNGRSSVQADADGRVDFTICTTATDLAEFLLGMHRVWPFALRRARVQPWRRLPASVRLLRLLSPTCPWYSSLGERR
ncbi:MAG: GNAT family N-acetyltransferase [Candidatus Krumholzibacteria bacterium]|nr:GNAT family N-acetyltransferase [Candidatus Krumholzibacteria bacterium]